MSQFTSVQTPDIDGLRIVIEAPNRISLGGTITVRSPEADLQPFIKKLHEAALADALSELEIDVSQLEFVNSSAIRVLIDWTTWAKSAAASNTGYKLVFTINRGTTWQRTSFVALQALAANVIEVR